MTTLEDVIKALAMCDTGADCRECPYFGDDREDLTQLRRDALEYLYMYQGTLRVIDCVDKLRREFEEARDKHIREIARYQEAIQNCEAAENKYKAIHEEWLQMKWLEEQNPLLTWEDLCRVDMVGKPVWNADRREWMLIIDNALDGSSWVYLVDNCGKQIRLEPHDLKKYQLYRREKKCRPKR